MEATKGMFIEYGVAYTDMYNGFTYTTVNGWRLLDFEENDDGTLSNVKLISTGIPARLNYEGGRTYKPWYVTSTSLEDTPNLTTFTTDILGNSYETGVTPSSNEALQAAAGMYYNLGSIEFAYGTSAKTAWESDKKSYNKGFFKSITNGNSTYNVDTINISQTGDELFKARTDAKIRLLTLPEINAVITGRNDPDSLLGYTDDTTGLYKLSTVSTISGLSLSTYDNNTMYWLASPNPTEDNVYRMCCVKYDGSIDTANQTSYGIRPVIYISSDIALTKVTEDGWTYYTISEN